MTEHVEHRQRDEDTPPLGQDAPEAGRSRSGSGAPVSEDPTGDAEYRGTDDQDAGPVFVDTPDGDQEYGRVTR